VSRASYAAKLLEALRKGDPHAPGTPDDTTGHPPWHPIGTEKKSKKKKRKRKP